MGKPISTWESTAGNLAASRLITESRERGSCEPKSRDGGRYRRSDYGSCKEWDMWGKREREDDERGRNRWLVWNFDPRRNPEPDPNWPRQMQVKIGPLPGHVSRDQLEHAVRQFGALRRLFLQHNHTDFRPIEIRYAYVVFREHHAALRLLKAACIQVADDYFKAGSMEERS